MSNELAFEKGQAYIRRLKTTGSTVSMSSNRVDKVVTKRSHVKTHEHLEQARVKKTF